MKLQMNAICVPVRILEVEAFYANPGKP